MDWQQLRRIRRRVRHTFRMREWPWRRKVAVGAWLPVLIVGFVLFTGPNQAAPATNVVKKPKTVTTVLGSPVAKSATQLGQAFRNVIDTKKAVSYWIQAEPKRPTVKMQA